MSEPDVVIPERWTIESAKKALQNETEVSDNAAADAIAIAALAGATHEHDAEALKEAQIAAMVAVERLIVLSHLDPTAVFTEQRCQRVAFAHLLSGVPETVFDEYESGGFVALCEEFGLTFDQVREAVGDE